MASHDSENIAIKFPEGDYRSDADFIEIIPNAYCSSWPHLPCLGEHHVEAPAFLVIAAPPFHPC